MTLWLKKNMILLFYYINIDDDMVCVGGSWSQEENNTFHKILFQLSVYVNYYIRFLKLYNRSEKYWNDVIIASGNILK